MKVVHNSIKNKPEEPEANPTVIARIRNWFRNKMGGTGIPVQVMDAETNKPVEDAPQYKYNVDINTGAGVLKLSQESTSEENAKQAALTWVLNNKIKVKPELIGEVKNSIGLFRYKCTTQTGTGTFVREIHAPTAEKAIENAKVWWLTNKMQCKIVLVGPVRKKQDA